MAEYIQFALEMRRRVKEQLKRMNPIEFPKVNLSYIDKETGDEFFAECNEIGATRLIPEGPLPPGDVFSVGCDTTNERVALFRIQVAALPGNGRFQLVGVSAKGVKESARMAFDYLRANAKRVGLDRDLGQLRLQHPGHESHARQGHGGPGRSVLHRHPVGDRQQADRWQPGRHGADVDPRRPEPRGAARGPPARGHGCGGTTGADPHGERRRLWAASRRSCSTRCGSISIRTRRRPRSRQCRRGSGLAVPRAHVATPGPPATKTRLPP